MKTESAKHMPNWEIGAQNEQKQYIIHESEHPFYSICAVNDYPNGEQHARLIATAPEVLAERDRLREVNAELLEACKYLMANLSPSRFNIRKDFSVINGLAGISKAVYKAEGGKQ